MCNWEMFLDQLSASAVANYQVVTAYLQTVNHCLLYLGAAFAFVLLLRMLGFRGSGGSGDIFDHGGSDSGKVQQCTSCHGTGNNIFKCGTCNGSGFSKGGNSCLACNGRRFHECPFCHGTGIR